MIRRKIGVAIQPGINYSTTLNRIYTVHPSTQELYYLRMLLLHVKGPRSLDEVKTANNKTFPTFRQCCVELGLLECDQMWKLTMQEAAETKAPGAMRQMFVTLLLYCEVSDPLSLWNEFKIDLCEDFLHKLSDKSKDKTIAENQALSDISFRLQRCGNKKMSDVNLPQPQHLPRNNPFLESEKSYNKESLKCAYKRNVAKFNDDQEKAFNAIMKSIHDQNGAVYFLDAPGGTGKTFVLQTLLDCVRSSGEIAVACASSGIASTLLTGGRTAHTTFKLPFENSGFEDEACGVTANSYL